VVECPIEDRKNKYECTAIRLVQLASRSIHRCIKLTTEHMMQIIEYVLSMNDEILTSNSLMLSSIVTINYRQILKSKIATKYDTNTKYSVLHGAQGLEVRTVLL